MLFSCSLLHTFIDFCLISICPPTHFSFSTFSMSSSYVLLYFPSLSMHFLFVLFCFCKMELSVSHFDSSPILLFMHRCSSISESDSVGKMVWLHNEFVCVIVTVGEFCMLFLLKLRGHISNYFSVSRSWVVQ